MAFPKRYAEIAARWRVRAGFVVGALFLWLAQPTGGSLVLGGGLALAGLGLRGWAAGHLEKFERLTTSGPFAHLRNPLYAGTLIVGAGFAIAGAQLLIGVSLIAFFVLFYLPVIEEEESYLREKFPGYAEYQRRVPRLWPAIAARYASGQPFRFGLYRKNREYEALAGFLVVIFLLLAKYAL